MKTFFPRRVGSLIIVLALFAVSSAYAEKPYLNRQTAPDAGVYLPAPPDTASVHFATDFLTWQYGKTLRQTPRGEQARQESMWSAEEMMRIFSEALQTPINDDTTPAIAHFIRALTATSHYAPLAAKEKYMRMRPFARMNEPLGTPFDNEEELRHNGSYPSGHTALGWLTALAMVEVAPEYRDTILCRGFQYGEDRWIVGAHWLSDVQAGYLCASATLAKAHTVPQYAADLKAARDEWQQLSSFNSQLSTSFNFQLSTFNSILSSSFNFQLSTFNFYDDLMGYYEGKAQRQTAAGEQAIKGDAKKTEDLMHYFEPAVGIPVSPEKTPALYRLLDYAHERIKAEVGVIKALYPRTRPYAQFGEPSLLPENEQTANIHGSFPSAHSARGWGMALILTELVPDSANSILTIGYEYGYNRVIAGYHYLSDVQAARLVASSTVAQLHTDSAFCQRLEEAKNEYRKNAKR